MEDSAMARLTICEYGGDVIHELEADDASARFLASCFEQLFDELYVIVEDDD
jgi:hypothetical protein